MRFKVRGSRLTNTAYRLDINRTMVCTPARFGNPESTMIAPRISEKGNFGRVRKHRASEVDDARG